jgi:hypothetical protein
MILLNPSNTLSSYDIFRSCKGNNQITLKDLQSKYPELTKQGVTKWLKILV